MQDQSTVNKELIEENAVLKQRIHELEASESIDKRMEQSLQESESRFSQIADTAPVLIWISGPDKHCIYFNKVWLEFTGRSLAQEFGNGWAAGVHPDDLQRCLDIYVNHFDSRQEFLMEYRLRRVDGEFRWLRDNGTPRYDSTGGFLGYVGSCVDITESKRAEEALQLAHDELEQRVADRTADLRKSQEHLEHAHRLAHIGIWAWIADIDTVTWTAELYRIAGRNPMMPAPTYAEHYNLYAPASWNLLKDAAEKALETGAPYQLELELIRPDGTKRWVNAFGGAKYDDGGRIIGLQGTMQDITERKRSEEERFSSAIKFREIFNRSIDAIGVSHAGVHEFVNGAYATMFGYETVDELIGKPILELIAPREHATIRNRINRRAQGEQVPLVYETWGIRRDGTEFIMDVHVSTYEMFGVIYTLVIMRDITFNKEAEETLLKSEKAAQRIAQENDLIAEIGRIISSTLNIEEVYERFAEKVREAIPFDRIAVNMVNKRDESLIIRYVNGDTFSGARIGQVLSLATTATDQVIRTRSSLLINGKNREKVMRNFSGMQSLQYGAQSGMVIPLISKNEVIASMVVYSAVRDAYTEKDLLLAERVGSQIAGAIANAQLFTERKQVEVSLLEERRQLQQAFDEIRTLRGIVPICSYCKKIRDDTGYWDQVEQYVSKHTDAKFSHGICPACFEKEMEEMN